MGDFGDLPDVPERSGTTIEEFGTTDLDFQYGRYTEAVEASKLGDPMADDTGMDLTADSIVVTLDVPKSFSWIVKPALPEQVRHMQWWFNMAPTVPALKLPTKSKSTGAT